jgi:hypothetical protein
MKYIIIVISLTKTNHSTVQVLCIHFFPTKTNHKSIARKKKVIETCLNLSLKKKMKQRKRTTLSMKHVWIYLIINYFYATNHISKRSEVDHKPKKVSMHWNNNEIRIIMKYDVNGIMTVCHG